MQATSEKNRPHSNNYGHVRAGRLRALGVSTEARIDVLPDLPTVGEFRAGLRGDRDSKALARRATRLLEIIDKLNREINAGLADPEDQGGDRRPWQRSRLLSRIPNTASSSRKKPRNGAR